MALLFLSSCKATSCILFHDPLGLPCSSFSTILLDVFPYFLILVITNPNLIFPHSRRRYFLKGHLKLYISNRNHRGSINIINTSLFSASHKQGNIKTTIILSSQTVAFCSEDFIWFAEFGNYRHPCPPSSWGTGLSERRQLYFSFYFMVVFTILAIDNIS